MNELALFAGAGGGILGGKLLGWKTVCAVEFNSFCCRRLMQRQNEGHLPPFPIWDDVRTFDGKPWRGIVDVVSGGFPCQDISVSGKGDGLDGERSGLWGEMARIICEVQPKYVFVENSPALTSRGLGRVLGDLAAMGFDARWGVLGAHNAGAPHLRDRLWIVAHAVRLGLRGQEGITKPASDQERDAQAHREIGRTEPNPTEPSRKALRCAGAYGWPDEPSVPRMAHGVAHRVDRLRAIGNGQVARVAATAWEILS